MLADLHIHSWYSDGTSSPQEIIKQVKEKGIGIISICDHNMISGYEEIKPLCKKEEINLILGTEINSLFEETEYHILAYDFDSENQNIKELMAYNQDIMEQIGIQLVEVVAKDYENVSLDEFSHYQRIKENGGWKSIDYLKSKSIIKGYEDYIQFCKQYKINSKYKFKTIKEITQTIHKAGGKAILAHSGDMVDNNPTIFKPTLQKLLAQGIDGFECYYTSHSDEITNMLLEFCKEHNLLITAGSDYHGGFNNIVNKKEYYIGAVEIDESELNLKGIKML